MEQSINQNEIISDDDDFQIQDQFIFKTLDPTYPFRLICQENNPDVTGGWAVHMYKSVDGINWPLNTRQILIYSSRDT